MLSAKTVQKTLHPSIQVRPDFERVETAPSHFIPGPNWGAQTVKGYAALIQMRGGSPHAQQLEETYRIIVHGTLEPIMTRYRALLLNMLSQDEARDRLLDKLTSAGIPMPPNKAALTPEEVMGCLEDFQGDEEKHLKKENAIGHFLMCTTPILKTGVAWPFFSTILENTGYTGLIPTVGGLVLAASAGAITSGLILMWMRNLFGLLPAPQVTVELDNGSTAHTTETQKQIQKAIGELHPARQTHGVVNAILFAIATLLLIYLWNQWRVVDFFTFTSKFHIPSETAQAMAATLVTLLMSAGLIGAYCKHNSVVGKRRISKVQLILRQWMGDEIATLYRCGIDSDTYNQICSQAAWAAAKVQQLALVTLWADITKPEIATAIKDQMIALQARKA